MPGPAETTHAPRGDDPTRGGPVLYFDGTCGLCNRWVDWLLRADRGGVLRFAPLQGVTAARHLPPERTAALDTLVLVEEGRLHVRSEAVLRVARHLGPVWRVITLLRGVPRPLRDRAYEFVARNRYRWFGRQDTCRVPTPAERGRMLP
jgi:predicted DCC family thiol-disulfide oxidoreductase YuxK